MKERPILFSDAMVRAILDGRKTQTRRVVKPAPDWLHPEPCSGETAEGFQSGLDYSLWAHEGDPEADQRRCPYGGPGDRLWVRETARVATTGWCSKDGHEFVIEYKAGGSLRQKYKCPKPFPACSHNKDFSPKWQPAIHMPRWASRITLEMTDVSVERLNDISESDAIAEGVRRQSAAEPIDLYMQLWEKINGTGSWATNPWVWVIEFKQVDNG